MIKDIEWIGKIRFYWNIAILIRSFIFYSCFHTTITGLNSFDREQPTQCNIFTVWPLSENMPTLIYKKVLIILWKENRAGFTFYW
jgi:hypothetical protein